VQLFYLEELKNLGDILQSSSAHIGHSLCLLDAFLNRHEISLVVVVSHHGILHPLKVFLNFTLAFSKRLEQEYFLFSQRFSLLFQVLLPKLQNMILFLNNLISIFKLLDFLFELSLCPIKSLLLGRVFILQGLVLSISHYFLVFFISSKGVKFCR